MMLNFSYKTLPISSLFPFLYFMIRDFHIAKREEDIGYYAGYVGSAFMFGRALTSVPWGMIADRYGRKPVIMFGTISVVIFNTLFGFSTNFWMAVSTRFLLGSLCGILGPMRAYASEVCRKEHQALGMSIISTSWGIGLVIGPALGGFLAQPAEKYPNIFSTDSLFGRFPYLLPCLLISIFSVGVIAVCCLLPETLHSHVGDGEVCNDSVALGTAAFESNSPRKSLLKNWSLISSIIVYCVFQLHDMAYAEIFSLWAVSPRKNGGLSFSTADVGEVLAFSGLGLLLFQLFIYPLVERNFGPVMVSRIGAVLTIPLLSSYPFLAMLKGPCPHAADQLRFHPEERARCINHNRITQQQRGAANGISMSAMSLFKALGPAAGGSLFSWAQKRQDAFFFPGDQMIFFLLNMIELQNHSRLSSLKHFLKKPLAFPFLLSIFLLLAWISLRLQHSSSSFSLAISMREKGSQEEDEKANLVLKISVVLRCSDPVWLGCMCPCFSIHIGEIKTWWCKGKSTGTILAMRHLSFEVIVGVDEVAVAASPSGNSPMR
ncbi:hypothetical protein NC652_018239 [Populus alba x Populus x berolinensis]|nr:hypothetical protein NC652_018239 [Populus alba x Populus x berolinensis]